MATAPISLQAFQATRTECADLSTVIADECFIGIAGYVYMGDCVIERDGEGYTVTIGREIYTTADGRTLEHLEAMVYSWCLTEWPDAMGVSDDAHAFLCALQDSMTPWEFVDAMLANRDEANPSVCHMQDYCDANECALTAAQRMRDDRLRGDAMLATLEDYEDDTDSLIAEADTIYNASRPFIRGGAI